MQVNQESVLIGVLAVIVGTLYCLARREAKENIDSKDE